jgi:regulator of protease activity HflC (stomatin/prohibitin superfamily)
MSERTVSASLKPWAALVALFLLGVVVLDGFVVVPPGHRGVVVRLGHVDSGPALGEGFHGKLPLFDRVDKMSVQIKKFTAPNMQASSKDLQTVRTSCAVNYRLNPTHVSKVRQELGVGQGLHESTALQPQLQESIKAVTAKYNAQDLIAKRKAVGQEMRQTFQKKLDNLVPQAFLVDEFSITDFAFSDTFTRAIEAKVEANERALQARNEVSQAEAEASKRIAQARGEAESVRIQAEAEAQAIRIRAQALREYPEVLKLESIQRWDGQLPKVVAGEQSMELQVDLPGVAKSSSPELQALAKAVQDLQPAKRHRRAR